MFGCHAFTYIPKDENFKLDGKARQCIFLGYSIEKLGYSLSDPKSKKVIRNRDIVFLEDQSLEDFKKETIQVKKSSTNAIVDFEPISPPVTHGDVKEVQDHLILVQIFLQLILSKENRGSSPLHSHNQYHS